MVARLATGDAVMRWFCLGAVASVASVVAQGASAQPVTAPYTATPRQVAAATLLLPFTTLNASAAGRAALAGNLATSIAVNSGADAARRAIGLNDIQIDGAYGWQLTDGLGARIAAAYNGLLEIHGGPDGTPAAVKPADPRLDTIARAFTGFTGVSGGASAFTKTFYANGKFGNTQPVTNIGLPSGGRFNSYDTAYLPQTPPTPAIPLNPNGDSRPYQVRPAAIDPLAGKYNAKLTANSAFPSGHQTYGMTEALLEAMAVPERFQQEVTRGTDYGYSRVVVGAHYALDVIGGRILATQQVARILNDDPAYSEPNANRAVFEAFAAAFRGVIADACGASVGACAATPDTGRFADYARDKAGYTYRLTYGLPPVGPTDLAPVVPAGAEVLLETRFPYLGAEQRRAVLASTEIASGGALDDGSGWARLNLFAAGGGYGAFEGVVTVAQKPGEADAFTNDIGGAGGLAHSGEGVLRLTGANSYAGGTTIGGGRLVAASDTALGHGDVSVGGGVLRVEHALRIEGRYRQTGGGLDLAAQPGGRPALTIARTAKLGGTLDVDLGRAGTRRSERNLIAYAAHSGRFASVAYSGLARGYGARLTYGARGVSVSVTPLSRRHARG